MIILLTSITCLLAITTGYYAYKHSSVLDRLETQSAKLESVLAYVKTLEESAQQVTASKQKTVKKEPVTKATSEVTSTRGRKPKNK